MNGKRKSNDKNDDTALIKVDKRLVCGSEIVQ